jgi:hypothetical protein
LRPQRLWGCHRVFETRARAHTHRLRGHRCTPRRRRVLRFRIGPGTGLCRFARRRTLPVPGQRRCTGDGPRRSHRQQAQYSHAPGRR